MFNFVIYFVELIICFLLQNTVFAWLNIGGIIPDLLIVLIVTIGYHSGRIPGMIAGIITGLLLDITAGSLLGVYALCYMFIGYSVGLISKYYVKRDTAIPLFLIAVGEFLFMIYAYIVTMLTHNNFEILYYAKRIMFPKVLYTAVVGIILYKLFDWVFNKIIVPAKEEN